MEMELLLPPPVLLPMNPEVHTAQVATAPPPPQPKHNVRNHPPYAKMIVTAIKTLNEKKGSSRKAIAKFIDSTYSNLPVTHSALLTHHLKRLKKKGIVLMVKHSYKLPKSPTVSSLSSSDPLLLVHSNNEQKRGRGRPPKPKPVLLSSPDGLGLPLLFKRGPGRPPNSKSKPKTNGLDKGRRPRGRPRKDTSVVTVTVPVAAASAPASAAPSTASVPAVVLGKRGRPRGPPKVRGPLPMKPPPKVRGPLPMKQKKTGRPVGRPKKAKIPDGTGMGIDGGGSGGGVFLIGSDGGVVGGGGELTVVMGGGSSEMKRGRGRPPKKVGGGIGIGGVVKTKRVSTGRPVGRPRKISVEGTIATTTSAIIPTTTTTTTAPTDVNENN